MADTERYRNWILPEDDDSIAAGAGLTQLRNSFILADSTLTTPDGATPAPACHLLVKIGNATQSLGSSSVVANPTYTWSSLFNTSGTIAPTFVNATGFMTFPTAGYYRVTWVQVIAGSSTPTEGYITVGLKETATAAFVARCSKTAPMETWLGETYVHKTMLIRAGSSGTVDVNLTSSYVLATVQENSSAASVTVGGANSWIALEYVRPL